MGRLWDFLNQDANKAMDRLVEPYVRFALTHRLIMWLASATMVALFWILVSKTVALLVVGVYVVLLLYGATRVLWQRYVAR
jgi:hypothetical protein